ncbi:MAG: hypothetical protein V1698_02795 [bacterium]
MLDKICQIIILLLAPIAILLISKKIKWGFVVGMASQPFWIATSYLNKQWGVFAVSLLYLFVWANGIYEWFLKPGKGL